MTRKTKTMLLLGAAFTGAFAASIVVPFVGRGWADVVIAATVFLFLAVAFEPTNWVIMAMPGFLLTVIALNYFRLHMREPTGIGVLIVTLAANSILLWVRQRRSAT